MDERVLIPSTSVLAVLVVGMVAGHTMMPARPVAGSASRAGFVLLVAAAGALGGWRTGRVIGGRRHEGSGRRSLMSAIAGALLSVAIAAAGYGIVHG